MEQGEDGVGAPRTPWVPEQADVIQWDAGGRILVDAGPGTGKTATACARIAWLISEAGVDASEIWLISFTRTAVHELRQRIAGYLRDPREAASLKIATIDSHAWAIHSGFDELATLSGSFDDNIDRVIEMVRNHEGVFEYLEGVRHLVVDEAQDVVGRRCELLLEIVHALPRSSGVSVFCDEAQAIYGFAEEGGKVAGVGDLPSQIRQFMADEFREMELNQIHRTQDKTLLQIFAEGRKLMREQGPTGASRLESVRALVTRTNHGNAGLYREDLANLPAGLEDAFLLFRRRGEVLDASSYLGVRPHRLRMSGLPTCIHGWVSVIFWDWVKPEIDRADFELRWKQRMSMNQSPNLHEAWSNLVSAFGRSEGRVSVAKLVGRLAKGSPPSDLALPEFGSSGPIIGTIHGSKGREAGEVRVYLPPTPAGCYSENQLDEEARVMFVAATRAKSRLRVGKAGTKAIAKRLDGSGRAYTPYPWKGACARVEVGRAKDIDAVGLAGVHLFGSRQDAEAAQGHVMQLGNGMKDAHAVTNPEKDWRYEICTKEENRRLCYLAKGVNHDLFKLANIVKRRRPPGHLNYLYVFGFRTLVLAADDPVRHQLHAPWKDSGVLAAPMLIGYPFAYFG